MSQDQDPFMALTPAERRRRNLLLLAERQQWPPGVLEEVLAAEETCPGWMVWWQAEAPRDYPGLQGPLPPARSFRARLLHPSPSEDPQPFAATAEQLVELIRQEDKLRAERDNWFRAPWGRGE